MLNFLEVEEFSVEDFFLFETFLCKREETEKSLLRLQTGLSLNQITTQFYSNCV